MGYIYKATNKINGQSYIGQTRDTIEERIKGHVKAAKNFSNEEPGPETNFPFHAVIRKYGIENFEIECLEECPDELLDEKEIYYIKLYDTYNNGYNAALGGLGHQKYNYDDIVNFFLQNNNSIRLTCEHFHIYDQVVYSALKSKGIDYKSLTSCKGKRIIKNKKIILVELNKEFNSMKEIDEFFGKQVHGNIRRCLNGNTEKAYGYHWKEVDIEENNNE